MDEWEQFESGNYDGGYEDLSTGGESDIDNNLDWQDTLGEEDDLDQQWLDSNLREGRLNNPTQDLGEAFGILDNMAAENAVDTASAMAVSPNELIGTDTDAAILNARLRSTGLPITAENQIGEVPEHMRPSDVTHYDLSGLKPEQRNVDNLTIRNVMQGNISTISTNDVTQAQQRQFDRILASSQLGTPQSVDALPAITGHASNLTQEDYSVGGRSIGGMVTDSKGRSRFTGGVLPDLAKRYLKDGAPRGALEALTKQLEIQILRTSRGMQASFGGDSPVSHIDALPTPMQLPSRFQGMLKPTLNVSGGVYNPDYRESREYRFASKSDQASMDWFNRASSMSTLTGAPYVGMHKTPEQLGKLNPSQLATLEAQKDIEADFKGFLSLAGLAKDIKGRKLSTDNSQGTATSFIRPVVGADYYSPMDELARIGLTDESGFEGTGGVEGEMSALGGYAKQVTEVIGENKPFTVEQVAQILDEDIAGDAEYSTPMPDRKTELEQTSGFLAAKAARKKAGIEDPKYPARNLIGTGEVPTPENWEDRAKQMTEGYRDIESSRWGKLTSNNPYLVPKIAGTDIEDTSSTSTADVTSTKDTNSSRTFEDTSSTSTADVTSTKDTNSSRTFEDTSSTNTADVTSTKDTNSSRTFEDVVGTRQSVEAIKAEVAPIESQARVDERALSQANVEAALKARGLNISSAEQGSAEWLANRTGTLTSTGIGTSMSESVYGDTWMGHIKSAINEKRNPEVAAQRSNPMFDAGTRGEELGKKWFEDKFDKNIVDLGLITDPKKPNQGTSVDGVVTSRDGTVGANLELTEFKWGTTRFPPRDAAKKHQQQLQHQMYMTGAESVNLVTGYDPNAGTPRAGNEDDYVFANEPVFRDPDWAKNNADFIQARANEKASAVESGSVENLKEGYLAALRERYPNESDKGLTKEEKAAKRAEEKEEKQQAKEDRAEDREFKQDFKRVSGFLSKGMSGGINLQSTGDMLGSFGGKFGMIGQAASALVGVATGTYDAVRSANEVVGQAADVGTSTQGFLASNVALTGMGFSDTQASDFTQKTYSQQAMASVGGFDPLVKRLTAYRGLVSMEDLQNLSPEAFTDKLRSLVDSGQITLQQLAGMAAMAGDSGVARKLINSYTSGKIVADAESRRTAGLETEGDLKANIGSLNVSAVSLNAANAAKESTLNMAADNSVGGKLSANIAQGLKEFREEPWYKSAFDVATFAPRKVGQALGIGWDSIFGDESANAIAKDNTANRNTVIESNINVTLENNQATITTEQSVNGKPEPTKRTIVTEE